MALSRDMEARVIGYFMRLEGKLRQIDLGIEFHIETRNALICRVMHPVLENALPGLVYHELAYYTIWQSPQGVGLKERFDLGSLYNDEKFAELQKLPPPKWNSDAAIKLARFVAPRLAQQQIDEFVGSPKHEPAVGLVHRFYDLQNPPTQIYAGSAMYLRFHEGASLEESPLEQRLRQYLDFLHTQRQEREPVRRTR
jgi:hypothetical protein